MRTILALSIPICGFRIVGQFEIEVADRRGRCHVGNMEQTLEHLQKILDLLGPGLLLEMDKAAFSRSFGGDIGRDLAEIEAKRFAERLECCFFSDGETVRFGRAYTKRISS